MTTTGNWNGTDKDSKYMLFLMNSVQSYAVIVGRDNADNDNDNAV